VLSWVGCIIGCVGWLKVDPRPAPIEPVQMLRVVSYCRRCGCFCYVTWVLLMATAACVRCGGRSDERLKNDCAQWRRRRGCRIELAALVDVINTTKTWQVDILMSVVESSQSCCWRQRRVWINTRREHRQLPASCRTRQRVRSTCVSTRRGVILLSIPRRHVSDAAGGMVRNNVHSEADGSLAACLHDAKAWSWQKEN